MSVPEFDDDADMENDECQRCHGTGHVKIFIGDPEDPEPLFGDRDCPDCGGSGRERDPEELAEMRYFHGPGWND